MVAKPFAQRSKVAAPRCAGVRRSQHRERVGCALFPVGCFEIQFLLTRTTKTRNTADPSDRVFVDTLMLPKCSTKIT